MLWCHGCLVGVVLELKLETNKLFLESKIDIFKVRLTNRPEMKEIKRMRADYFQFNFHNREAQYLRIFYLLSYYLHYLSKVHFNLPGAVAS